MSDPAHSPYLSAGDVAKRTGVSAGAVTLWERTGKLVPVMRTEGGMRLYAVEDVERFLAERAR